MLEGSSLDYEDTFGGTHFGSLSLCNVSMKFLFLFLSAHLKNLNSNPHIIFASLNLIVNEIQQKYTIGSFSGFINFLFVPIIQLQKFRFLFELLLLRRLPSHFCTQILKKLIFPTEKLFSWINSCYQYVLPSSLYSKLILKSFLSNKVPDFQLFEKHFVKTTRSTWPHLYDNQCSISKLCQFVINQHSLNHLE